MGALRVPNYFWNKMLDELACFGTKCIFLMHLTLAPEVKKKTLAEKTYTPI